MVVGAVVTAVSHVIPVIVILGWVIVEWTVVLEKKREYFTTLSMQPAPASNHMCYIQLQKSNIFYFMITVEVKNRSIMNEKQVLVCCASVKWKYKDTIPVLCRLK